MREPVLQRGRPLHIADTLDQSAKSRLVVIITLVCSYIRLDIGDHVGPPLFLCRAETAVTGAGLASAAGAFKA